MVDKIAWRDHFEVEFEVRWGDRVVYGVGIEILG